MSGNSDKMSNSQEFMEKKQIGSLVRCMGCKAYNEADSKYCLLCGLQLHKECPNCGTHSNDQFAIHCTKCGAKFNEVSEK